MENFALLLIDFQRRAGELYLAGVSTNFVVESALRHAADSGFSVKVIDDCCASADAQMHEFAITKIFPAYGELCSADDFIRRTNNAS